MKHSLIAKAEMLIRKPVAEVFVGAKAFLGHKVRLNLVPDRLPDGIGEH